MTGVSVVTLALAELCGPGPCAFYMIHKSALGHAAYSYEGLTTELIAATVKEYTVPARTVSVVEVVRPTDLQ